MGITSFFERSAVKAFGRHGYSHIGAASHAEGGLESGVGHAAPHESVPVHPPEPSPLHTEPTVPHNTPSIAHEANAGTRDVYVKASWVPTTPNIARGGVIAYGGVVAINTMQEMKRDAAKALAGLPKVFQPLLDVPKDSYDAFLRQMHELEAGISSGTGVGSSVAGLMTTTLGVVTLAGSLYVGLEFYRAYKS